MMRRALFLLVGSLVILSCEKSSAPVVDRDAAAKAVGTLFDSYTKATKERNYAALDTTLADDGLFLGTDPEEFWDKAKLMSTFKTASDSSSTVDISMDKREIRISEDGTMAIVVEQSNIPIMSEGILIRGVGHARLIKGQWKIDFYSWSLIPRNEDLEKVNKAVVK
jgi:ketosteroid isomerase-like protein